MSPLEELFDITTSLEQLLENKFGATGKGLHEKAESVGNSISYKCLKKIHFIATVRNKAAHEDRKIANQEIRNIRSAYREVMNELAPKKFNWGLALFIVAILIAAVVAYLKYMR